MSCNVGSVLRYHKWGNTDANVAALTVTGVTSSNSVTPTGTASLVSSNNSSIGCGIRCFNSFIQDLLTVNGVTVGVLKFTATNDAINLSESAEVDQLSI